MFTHGIKRFLQCIVILLITTDLFALDPTNRIQGVCRILLKNGQHIEGFISLTNMSHTNEANGFCIESRLYRTIIQFNPNFSSIIFEGARLRYHSSILGEDKILSYTPSKCYYIENVTSGLKDTIEDKTIQNDDGLKLERKLTYQDEYILLDYIPVYLELPDELYLDDVVKISPPSSNSKESGVIEVKISEIKKFKLLKEPSEELLKQIQEKEKKHLEYWEKVGGDYPIGPAWFHDIYKKAGLKNLFRQVTPHMLRRYEYIKQYRLK